MTKKKVDHEALGITFQELGALLGVRGMLESGALTHIATHKASHYGVSRVVSPTAHEFNMRHTLLTQGCGTLGCIGGAMALIMNRKPTDYVDALASERGHQMCSVSLVNLLYPDKGIAGIVDANEWDRITPKVAVMAIDRFLAGKRILWRSLVERHGLTKAQARLKAHDVMRRISQQTPAA